MDAFPPLDALSTVERDAVRILLYEAVGRHREANEAKVKWAREKDEDGQNIVVLLTTWLKVTNTLVKFNHDDIETDYALARSEWRRDPDDDHKRCAYWCMRMTRNVVITQDVDEFIDAMLMLNSTPLPGLWIETMLSSLANICGEAIAARQQRRRAKARMN